MPMWRGARPKRGCDLTFLRTIPGTIGGAVRMNAGCYGSYVADALVSATVIGRDGREAVIAAADLHLAYRQSRLPDGAIIVSATFRCPRGAPDELERRMADQLATRDATQAHQGPHRRLDLPQSGGIFQHRAGRRYP